MRHHILLLFVDSELAGFETIVVPTYCILLLDVIILLMIEILHDIIYIYIFILHHEAIIPRVLVRFGI